MSLNRKIVVLATSTLLLATAACGTPERDTGALVEDNVDDPVAEAEHQLSELGQRTVDETEALLGRAGQEFEQVKARVSEFGEDASDEFGEHWNSLTQNVEEARGELRDDLSALRGATGEEAEELQREIAEERLDLERWMAEARYVAIANKEEFERTLDSELGEFRGDVSDVEAEIASASNDVQEEAREDLDELKQQWADLESRAAELKTASGEAFTEMRIDVARATAEFERHLRALEWRLDRANMPSPRA